MTLKTCLDPKTDFWWKSQAEMSHFFHCKHLQSANSKLSIRTTPTHLHVLHRCPLLSQGFSLNFSLSHTCTHRSHWEKLICPYMALMQFGPHRCWLHYISVTSEHLREPVKEQMALIIAHQSAGVMCWSSLLFSWKRQLLRYHVLWLFGLWWRQIVSSPWPCLNHLHANWN